MYLEVREARYRIPRAVPAWLSDDAWKLLERTFLDIARQEQRADEALEEAAERLVRAGLERWFGRKGRDGFLVRERHKIQHFPKDLEWVASQIAAPPLRDPDRASPESKPAPMPAPDELRRLIAEGAREVASAASGGRRAA
ncbi:MAG: hypothetical protein IT372_28910 [Polyangiaceae bacterium]|nr:hypothetical protein [Polyangiaceae bacterium]